MLVSRFTAGASVVLIALATCSKKSAPTSADDAAGARVGIVFDVGGRGDKSSNDAAWEGAERARKDLGMRTRFAEPGDDAERTAELRRLAGLKLQLVIGVGFAFTDDLLALAAEYPNVSFAGVELGLRPDKQGNPLPLPANLAALKFREEEGCFLVGALAALAGGSKKIGFIGGMPVPLIRKFEGGYRQGVKAVCEDCEVIAQYAGDTPEAFRNPAMGKQLALAQYDSGVNVIFQASGSTARGIFEAAQTKRKLVIGMEADQYAEAPGFVLTSMTKHVDSAVFDMIAKAKDGSFRGGVVSYGLAEGGVGYVYDEHNRDLISEEVRAKVEALRKDIIEGRIKVVAQ